VDRQQILRFSVGPPLAALLGFVALPITARIFPVADVGRINIFNTFLSLSLMFLLLGMDQAYVREYHETDSKQALFKECFLPGLLLLLLCSLLLFPSSAMMARWLYGEARPGLFLLSLLAVLFAYSGRFLSLIVRMQERGLAYSLSQVLPKLATVVLLVSYFMVKFPPTFTSLLTLNIVGLLLVVMVFGWNTRKEWLASHAARMDSRRLKTMLGYALPLVPAGVVYWGLAASSTIALRIYSGFSELGIYAMAMSIAGVGAIFQSVFATIWMPTVYKWNASGIDIDKKVERVRDALLSVVVMVFVLAGCFSWLLEYLLPSAYSQVKYIVICCLAQPLLFTLSESTVVGINLTRKTHYGLLACLLALIASVAVNIALVPAYGARGAAVAQAAGFFVFLVARTEASARLWRAGPRKKFYLSVLVIVCGAALTALYGAALPVHYSIAWAALVPLVLVVFRHEYAAIWNLVKRKKTS
jgi:O-antigen/teichoic acid export membrane protein